MDEVSSLPTQPVLSVRGDDRTDPRSVLLHPVRRSDLTQAWGGFLSKQPWHWFATQTFAPTNESAHGGMHPEKADKVFRLWVSTINRELYGNCWQKRHHRGLVWVRGQEFHKSGRIHFHSCVAAPTDDLNRLYRRWDAMQLWEKLAGFARIESPQCQQDVCDYISKYVAKDGQLDFSKNFGAVLPPRLDWSALPRQASIQELDRATTWAK